MKYGVLLVVLVLLVLVFGLLRRTRTGADAGGPPVAVSPAAEESGDDLQTRPAGEHPLGAADGPPPDDTAADWWADGKQRG